MPDVKTDVSAERLHRLQQASAALARAADASEIARELGRGVSSTAGGEGVFVVQPDLDRLSARVLYQESGGVELPARDVRLGDGAIIRAGRGGESVALSGAAATRAAAADGAILPTVPKTTSLLVVPAMHGRRLLALVGAHSASPDAFGAESVAAARTLATQAAMALSNAQLFAESERERRQIEALADAARAVSASLRMGEVVRLILRHATGLLRSDGACVGLREGKYLHIVAALGMADLLSGVHIPLAGSIAGRAVLEGTTVICNDVVGDPATYRPALRFAPVEKMIVAPLSTSRGVLGALMLFNRADDFGGDDARVLQRLADQVAVAIVNARLFEELSEASRAWTSTFEAIGVGMVIVDDAGRIVRHNERARQLALDTEPRELAGRTFYEAIVGATPSPNDDRPIERALREGTMVRGTLQIPGTGRWLQLTAAPHLDRGVIVTFDEVPEAAVTEQNTT